MYLMKYRLWFLLMLLLIIPINSMMLQNSLTNDNGNSIDVLKNNTLMASNNTQINFTTSIIQIYTFPEVPVDQSPTSVYVELSSDNFKYMSLIYNSTRRNVPYTNDNITILSDSYNNDLTYEFSIPQFERNVLLQYYIEITDDNNNVITSELYEFVIKDIFYNFKEVIINPSRPSHLEEFTIDLIITDIDIYETPTLWMETNFNEDIIFEAFTMNATDNQDQFTATIPGKESGSQITFWFEATDHEANIFNSDYYSLEIIFNPINNLIIYDDISFENETNIEVRHDGMMFNLWLQLQTSSSVSVTEILLYSEIIIGEKIDRFISNMDLINLNNNNQWISETYENLEPEYSLLNFYLKIAYNEEDKEILYTSDIFSIFLIFPQITNTSNTDTTTITVSENNSSVISSINSSKNSPEITIPSNLFWNNIFLITILNLFLISILRKDNLI